RGGEPDASIPADAYGRASFVIFVPASAVTEGEIAENDIAVDDLGKRYQIAAAEWTPLGYQLLTDLLKP
ncbi:MAG: hypothetical protein JO052_05930, partial [Bradyrhizobium sp.]|nr:hypothetical protein [Bradyrhizobium sp.]